MTSDRFQKAINGIEAVFSRPSEIQHAADLDRGQKIELLRQWEQDLRQRLLASAEGMIARRPGQASEILRQVESALREIGEE